MQNRKILKENRADGVSIMHFRFPGTKESFWLTKSEEKWKTRQNFSSRSLINDKSNKICPSATIINGRDRQNCPVILLMEADMKTWSSGSLINSKRQTEGVLDSMKQFYQSSVPLYNSNRNMVKSAQLRLQYSRNFLSWHLMAPFEAAEP